MFVFNAHLDLPFIFLTCAQFALQVAQEMPDKHSVSMCFDHKSEESIHSKSLKQQIHNVSGRIE